MNSQKFTLAPLFAGFIGTTGLSDFPDSFIGVVLLADARRGPGSPSRPNPGSPGFRTEGSAFLVRCFDACTGP
jgi:hypothetical protein